MLPSHFPRLHQGPATLWVTLRAVSIEADRRSIRLKIEWSGQWYPSKAEIENACKVSVIPTHDRKPKKLAFEPKTPRLAHLPSITRALRLTA